MVLLFVHKVRLLWETKTKNKTGFLLYGVETHRVVTGNLFLGAAAANNCSFRTHHLPPPPLIPGLTGHEMK